MNIVILAGQFEIPASIHGIICGTTILTWYALCEARKYSVDKDGTFESSLKRYQTFLSHFTHCLLYKVFEKVACCCVYNRCKKCTSCFIILWVFILNLRVFFTVYTCTFYSYNCWLCESFYYFILSLEISIFVFCYNYILVKKKYIFIIWIKKKL